MKATVSGENPFKVLQDTCTIGATTCGYTLCYSVEKDGVYSAYASATTANEVCVVNGLTPFCWLKLSGNTDEGVVVIL